jgi:hypothetical protein
MSSTPRGQGDRLDWRTKNAVAGNCIDHPSNAIKIISILKHLGWFITVGMKTNIALVTAIAVGGALGCASQDPPSEASSAQAVSDSDFGTSLARLNALSVVEVSAFGHYFTEGKNCYGSQIMSSIGMICPDEVAALHDRVAAADQKVAAFASAAEAAAHGPTHQGNPVQVAEDLEVLKSLKIVQVNGFIVDEPEPSNCYVAYCEESDRVRAGKLHAIVEAAKHLE